MVDWDKLEDDAGHNLTHCGMLGPGTQLYFCENCGAFMLTRHQRDGDGIQVFHLPPHSTATQDKCLPAYAKEPESTTLKDKLAALREADLERLKRDI